MKNTMFKKVFAIALCIVTVLSFLSISAFAADSETYNEGTAPTLENAPKTVWNAIKEAGLDLCTARNEASVAANQLATCATFDSATGTYLPGADYALKKSEDYPQRFTILFNGSGIDIYLAEKYVDKCKNVNAQPLMAKDGTLVDIGPKEADTVSVWNKLFGSIQGIITGLTGIFTLAFVILFMIQIFKLGSSAGNPTQRQQALTGLLWTGIAAAGLGAVTVVMSFFLNAV